MSKEETMGYSDTQALAMLARDEGQTIEGLIETYIHSSVQPGICIQCGYVNSRLEPDQDRGWCEECEAGTCKSVGVLFWAWC